MSATTFVLVHGAYHGGWCWKPVAARLRALGHVVYTPTLTGLGERSNLMRCDPSLDTFIEDVMQVIQSEDLENVVLVGHSFGGAVVSGVSDRIPERLRHLVYLDAQVLLSREAAADRAIPEVIEAYRTNQALAHGYPVVPPGDARTFDITDAALMDWVRPRLTPQPLRTYFDRLELANAPSNGLPTTYIACTASLFAKTATSRQRARELGWAWMSIATGHEAMLPLPDELADMLAGIGLHHPARVSQTTSADKQKP